MTPPGARAIIAAVLFRPEDEALLRRLEDEEVFARLVQRHVAAGGGRSAQARPRAAGMIAAAAASPAGKAARDRAVAGDLEPLATLVETEDLSNLSPELAHHVAVHFGRVARSVPESAFDVAVAAHERSLAAWLTLGAEGRYLARLSAEIRGDEGSGPASGAAAGERFAVERIDEVAWIAESAVPTLGRAGAAALAALARVPALCERLPSERLARRARARAESRRAQAIDLALEPVREAVAEATTRDLAPRERGERLVKAILVWGWAGHDALVEHFVVEQLVPIAWEIYRASQWEVLRALLAPFAPCVDSLAARIERDPIGGVAYAAACGDALMFEAEAETTLDRQIAIAERLLRVCPTHRNGRLVLAAYLCDKATRMVDQPFVGDAVAREAQALVDRAEALYPASKSLEAARAALARARAAYRPPLFWRPGS